MLVDYEIKGFIKSENGHMLRISDLQWIEIDENGFVEIRRKVEPENRKQDKYHKVTLPKPVKSNSDLNLLLGVLLEEVNTK